RGHGGDGALRDGGGETGWSGAGGDCSVLQGDGGERRRGDTQAAALKAAGQGVEGFADPLLRGVFANAEDCADVAERSRFAREEAEHEVSRSRALSSSMAS